MHLLLGLALAAGLAVSPSDAGCGPPFAPAFSIRLQTKSQPHHHKLHHAQRRAKRRPSNSKCANVQILQLREELLHDFLVRARTETPQFEDERRYRLNAGIAVGPVSVTRDFIGSPIIRARVTNLTSANLPIVLSAELVSKNGAQASASTVIFLLPFETRAIELLCPDSLVPQSLTWSTLQL